MKRSAYIETVVVLMMIICVNLLFYKNDLGFTNVYPHPFWFVVILIPMRYGLNMGIISSLIASLAYFVLLFAGSPEMEYKLLVYENFTQPLLFIISGILIGEIRSRQLTTLQEYRAASDQLQSALTALQKRYHALEKAKHELDNRIISQEHTLASLYQAAQGLKSLDEQNIYPAVMQLLKEFIGVQACSVYGIYGNTLKLITADPPQPPETSKHTVDAAHPMMGTAISTGDTVAINTILADKNVPKTKRSDILISAPIRNNRQQTFGVLNIEKLSFEKLNAHNVRLVTLIADWCGAAIENARTYQTTKDKNISDDTTGAYTNNYLHIRLNEELSRARRYALPLSVMVIEFIDFNQFDVQTQSDILYASSLIFRNKLRGSDLLFHDTTPERYVILLSNTNIVRANHVRKNILSAMAKFKFQPYPGNNRKLRIDVGIAEADTSAKSPKQLIENANLEMRREHYPVQK